MIKQKPSEVLRLIEAETARIQAASTRPVVVWCGLEEKPKAFFKRITGTKLPAKTLLLAVAPHGYTVPPRAQAVHLPAKCFRVLHPARTTASGRKPRDRALSGGRGSAKSWSIARVLILTAVSRTVRVLCAREFQKSIAESSHKLLSDQITKLGLEHWFDVKGQSISAKHNTSEFIFEGLYSNVSKIKSLEGIDIAWVEEAAKVSANSWEVLVPTVRNPGSEIWANYNPEDEDDPTYQRYSVSPPPDAVVDHVTYADNPWFPEELERERVYLLSVDPDAHAHVWDGGCKKQSDAMIFKGKYIVEEFEPQEHWHGPYAGSDFGFSNDPTTLVKCWVADRRLYIEHEAFKVGCDIDKTPDLFDTVPGCKGIPIRADSSRPETISYLQRYGYPEVRGVDKWPNSVEEGVKFLRQFEKIVIHPRCKHAQEEARLYSFKVDKLTGDVLTDIVDKHNHIWDAVRYALAPLIKVGSGHGFITYMKQRIGAATPQQSVLAPENREQLSQLPQPRKGAIYNQPGTVVRSFTGWGSEDK